MEFGMDYNNEILKISDISITLPTGEEVMMSWEHPLMKKHAEFCTKKGDIVLEVGFGMGISANYIQELNPSKHIIVESHSQIIDSLYNWSKDKPNVIIIEGDWFSKVDEICQYSYDGIFFDTHRDINRHTFKELIVDKSLKKGGVFTWFEPSGADTFNCEYQIETVDVNPINCNYYTSSTAECPYLIF